MIYNVIKYLGKRKILKTKTKKLIALLIAAVIIMLPVWFYNNFTVKTVYETINSSKIDGEIKIAVISDLHAYKFGKDNKKIVNGVKALSPDLIFFLGDMYSRGQTDKIGESVEFLEALAEITQVFIVTGDHDYDDIYKEELLKLENVKLLDYVRDDITVNSNELCIYGIDNVYFSSTFDLSNEFETPDEDKFNILLSHIPSIEHYGDFGFDLIFCGDTHGGMIRLPFLDGLYFNGYLLPKITYKGLVTDKGLYEFEKTSLFVTSGLGNYPLPLRFNNRPEICLITIKGE